MPDTVGFCYDHFDGYTYYNHKIFHDLFANASPGMTLDRQSVLETVQMILEENSHAYPVYTDDALEIAASDKE